MVLVIHPLECHRFPDLPGKVIELCLEAWREGETAWIVQKDNGDWSVIFADPSFVEIS